MSFAVLFLVFAASAAELYRQGVALFERGQLREAAQLFAQAAELAPTDAKIAKALGVSYAAMAEYERANQPLHRACTLDPQLADACFFYGRNLYALNRFEAALEALRKALSSSPSAWQVHLGIAQASEALGRSDEADTSFRKATALFDVVPTAQRGRPDFDPHLHHAIFLYRQGSLNEALEQAKKAAANWPEYSKAHFTLGRILHHLGQLEQAATALEQAVRGGNDAAAHLLLGRVYARLGRTAEAEAHLKAGASAPAVR